ncbi:MAG: hypothetical protein OXE83_01795 [Gammaproteobacteria bacterium]|nr:hypothetical protein [Gammaproteobacteria bacterium]
MLHGLADIQSSMEPLAPPARPKSTRTSTKGKPSAVEYVRKMPLPQEKAEVMVIAAERFEEKRFLPAFADIREFCRVHALKLGKSTSRAGAIPRVFSFLAAMDTPDLEKILDDGNFCGPSRLAPIADAIRSYPDSAHSPAAPR